MSDGKPVRATTADEEAVMFQQSWVKAEREANRLRAENEKLRAALKPFAELAEYYDVEPDAQPAWDRDFQPTVGELRAAAAALKEKGDD